MIELSPQEVYIIKNIRELRPFEIFEIHKDPTGLPNRYRIKRSQELVLNEVTIAGIKLMFKEKADIKAQISDKINI
jgi:hypothetical protein